MNELYCICGKYLGHKGFCSRECREIYERQFKAKQEQNLDIYKIYIQKNKQLVEYDGPPSVLKRFKPCSCGGTMKTMPLNHYYVEHKDGYYLVDISTRGLMMLSTHPTEVSWSCNKCNVGEQCE